LDVVKASDRISLRPETDPARPVRIVGRVCDLLTIEESTKLVALDFDPQLMPGA